MGKRRLHYFKINELDNERMRGRYRFYIRQFWHWYSGEDDRTEKSVGEAHLETLVQRTPRDILSVRLHTGNMGSETPWDGHFLVMGVGVYWGHTFFRKLASKISACSGYEYDTRNWMLSISDWRLRWEFGEHDDMCDKHRLNRRAKDNKKKSWPRYGNHWRRGSINLNLADKIWGPNRYTYERVDGFATMLKMEEGEYPVIIDIQKCFFGRTKVSRDKHEVSWNLDVDAPSGVPTHVDHSGGWKGDRTYGFGVKFDGPPREGWHQDAEAAVKAWVLEYRARTGFRSPDPVG